MPLAPTVEREEIHTRHITMRAYRRADGLYDIEGRVEDSKPVPFMAPLATAEKPAGEHIHDIWVRLVIDDEFLIHDIAASSDATPFGVCKEAPATLMKLKGERIGAGWNKIVRGHLKGAAGCTHMMELLGPLATAAYQALWPFIRSRPDPVDANGRPLKVNSCYAYASHTHVIKQMWPQHYTGPDKS